MTRLSPQSMAAIVALALLAAVSVLTSRPDQTQVDTYASTDYRSGGYRAWATLLAREGIATARFVLRPIELDARTDTLISAQPLPQITDPSARSAADLAALANWVRAGGHLVYVGRNAALADAETRLLSLPFGLPDVGARGGLSGPLAAVTGGLSGLGSDRMLFVEHPGRAELSDGNGDIVVRYPFGRGEIVAVVDTALFTNGTIVASGNARLAYLLGVPHRPGGVVAFDDGVHGALIDRPWYRALPLAVRVGLGIAAVAALLALIGSALRSGPAVRLRAPREPTSVEFVDALAALYERTRARTPAATILAHDAFAHAARGNGLRDDVEPAELAARIGERSDRTSAEAIGRLAGALAAPLETDGALVASAKLAHNIRKEWSHGRYGDRRRAAFAGRARTRRRR